MKRTTYMTHNKWTKQEKKHEQKKKKITDCATPKIPSIKIRKAKKGIEKKKWENRKISLSVACCRVFDNQLDARLWLMDSWRDKDHKEWSAFEGTRREKEWAPIRARFRGLSPYVQTDTHYYTYRYTYTHTYMPI